MLVSAAEPCRATKYDWLYKAQLKLLALSWSSHHASHPWDSELDVDGSDGLAADADADDCTSGMVVNVCIPGKVGGDWFARWIAITRC